MVQRPGLFGGLTGITMDLDGNIIVADPPNHCIRKIAADGTVSTLAGSYDRQGHADGSLDRALFNYPTDVAVDHEGHLIVAEHFDNCIRKISADGTVSTVAGSPSEARDHKDGMPLQARSARHLASRSIAMAASL